jgi:predicted alternative tryptophan synthase beta-subunit
MYTPGHNFIPDKIHAGGLRYHGAGVLVSQLRKDALVGTPLLEKEGKNQVLKIILFSPLQRGSTPDASVGGRGYYISCILMCRSQCR